MIKQVKLDNKTSTKVLAICRVIAADISQNELGVLWYLIEIDMQITLTRGLRADLCKKLGLSDSNLSTILYRLTDKGLIARQNKTIILNPMFRDLDQLTGVLVKFE